MNWNIPNLIKPASRTNDSQNPSGPRSRRLHGMLSFLLTVTLTGGSCSLSSAAPLAYQPVKPERSKTFTSVTPSTMSRADFVRTFGEIYEHSAWVAERCYDMGSVTELDDRETVFKRMSTLVNLANADVQLALIKLHPALGTTGPTTTALTHASAMEQKSSGLDRLSPEQSEELQKLNASYQKKFEFPFIMAISGKHASEIIDQLRRRINNSRALELKEEISEINKIAYLRLSKL